MAAPAKLALWFMLNPATRGPIVPLVAGDGVECLPPWDYYLEWQGISKSTPPIIWARLERLNAHYAHGGSRTLAAGQIQRNWTTWTCTVPDATRNGETNNLTTAVTDQDIHVPVIAAFGAPGLASVLHRSDNAAMRDSWRPVICVVGHGDMAASTAYPKMVANTVLVRLSILEWASPRLGLLPATLPLLSVAPEIGCMAIPWTGH